jgi:hypothetical protein
LREVECASAPSQHEPPTRNCAAPPPPGRRCGRRRRRHRALRSRCGGRVPRSLRVHTPKVLRSGGAARGVVAAPARRARARLPHRRARLAVGRALRRRPRGKVARAAGRRGALAAGGARARAARAADGARPDLHQVRADALDPAGRDPAGGGVRAAEAVRRRAVLPDGGGARAHRGGARPAGGGALRRPRRELDADRRRLARPGVPLPAARERRGDRAQGPAARHDPVGLARPLAAPRVRHTARHAAAAKLSTARRSAHLSHTPRLLPPPLPGTCG